MKNNLKINLKDPPDWWPHNSDSWSDLSCFFLNNFLKDESLKNESNWRKITTGRSNYNYQFNNKNKGDRYFIQVVNASNLPLLPQLVRPLNPKKIVAFFELEKWLVHCHLCSPNIKVFDWVNAKPITPSLFSTSATLFSSLVGFIVQLHRQTPPLSQEKQLPMLDINEHLARYCQLAASHSPSRSQEIKKIFAGSRVFTSDFVSSCFCHNDLGVNNLLWNKPLNELKIIDWEYACWGDPMFDIAGLILSCQLNEQQEKELLTRYSEQMEIKPPILKLENMKQLCQYLSRLWQLACCKEPCK